MAIKPEGGGAGGKALREELFLRLLLGKASIKKKTY